MTYHAKMLVSFPRTGATVLADVATDEASKIRGLHGRTGLGPNEGMLFQFAPQTAPIAMTMVNMLIPLDIIFIDEDMTIRHIVPQVQPGHRDPIVSAVAVPWVLEVSSGFARRHKLLLRDRVELL
jgi:hypothetical protein